MNKWTLIIPSGGTGSRMGASRPKQYIEIDGIPIIVHTLIQLDVLFDRPQYIISLVAPWDLYLIPHLEAAGMKSRVDFVSSGEERFNSVKNCLDYVHTEWVAVHDAVRPFVGESTIQEIRSKIETHPALVPVCSLTDSIRKIDGATNRALDRNQFVRVQTPQCFHSSVLKSAYKQDYGQAITDDACLVEAMGVSISLVAGNEQNIKITTPNDLIIAHQLLVKK